jgi:hypothetical protein
MREMVCKACSDRVALEGDLVRCACRRSAAHRARDGWTYAGPASIVLPVIVHEPERHGMGERLVPMPDDDVTRRAEVAPLL